MAAGPQRRRFSLPLFLLCAGLGWVVYLQVNAELPVPPRAEAPPPSAADAGAPVAVPEFEMPPLERFSESLERPLFMATRRPPEPVPEEEQAAPEPERPKPSLGLELSGIIITPGERLVLLRPLRSRELIRATVGQTVEGWVVESIHPERVVLRQGETREQLELTDKAPRREPPRRPRRTGQEPAAQAEPGAGEDASGQAIQPERSPRQPRSGATPE